MSETYYSDWSSAFPEAAKGDGEEIIDAIVTSAEDFDERAGEAELVSGEEQEASGEADSGVNKSSSELAEEYGVTDRSIQTWMRVCRDAYFWLDESQLMTGNSNRLRYTPLAQRLLQEFRNSGKPAADWTEQVHQANLDKFKQQQTQPDWQSTANPQLGVSSHNQQAAALIPWQPAGEINFVVLDISTEEIDEQAQQAKQLLRNTALQLRQAMRRRTRGKLAEVIAQTDHLLSVLGAEALVEAAEDAGLVEMQQNGGQDVSPSASEAL